VEEVSIANFAVRSEEETTSLRVAQVLNQVGFVSLLLLLAVSAVPYGITGPWWKATFIAAVFAICIVAILETLIRGENRIHGPKGILFSMLGLAVFAMLQTISLGGNVDDSAVNALGPWNAISADPYQTRFFALQIFALTTCLALLYRYCETKKRIAIIIHAVIILGVISALFGILRQTLQQQPGFVLPRTLPGVGYGQFINKNHFALFMEMALGLVLGMALFRGVSRDRMMLYVALGVPIWMGLVLSNSRAAILAMLCQVVIAFVLMAQRSSDSEATNEKRRRSTRALLLAGLVVVILFGTVWVGGDRLVTKFTAASTEFGVDESGERSGVTRNEIWRASWKMFTAHPVVGVGLGGYWIAITRYHDASGVSTPQEAHNDYLELLSSGGLVGLAIGIWFVTTLVACVRGSLLSTEGFQRSVCVAALLGLTGVAVHSLFDFGLHLLFNAFIFLILIALATRRFDGAGVNS
jgi:O-antigen ligase